MSEVSHLWHHRINPCPSNTKVICLRATQSLPMRAGIQSKATCLGRIGPCSWMDATSNSLCEWMIYSVWDTSSLVLKWERKWCTWSVSDAQQLILKRSRNNSHQKIHSSGIGHPREQGGNREGTPPLTSERGLEIKLNSYTCTKTPASSIQKKGWNLNQQNLSKIYTCVKAF